MHPIEKLYVKRIAEAARNQAVEQGLINTDAKILTDKQLLSIVDFYNGTLYDAGKDEFIKKLNNNTYSIHCRQPYNQFSVIYMLGYAFLHLEEMSNEESHCFDITDVKDDKAVMFARTFLMPEVLFLKDVVEHTDINGMCNVFKIADAYNIDYIEVIGRGDDLGCWNPNTP